MRLIAALLLTLPMICNALVLKEVTMTCLIGSETFTFERAMSGTQYGMHLDMKPYGPIASPWPIPKCPSNGFVMYKENFSDQEIVSLTRYVVSDEYKALKDRHTNYYLAASLQQHMGESALIIARTLLQATWEARSRSQYVEYARESLEMQKELLNSRQYKDQESWLVDELLAGELERRLGRFKDARLRFERIVASEPAKEQAHQSIIQLQLKLVEEKDLGPHKIPSNREPVPSENSKPLFNDLLRHFEQIIGFVKQHHIFTTFMLGVTFLCAVFVARRRKPREDF